MFSSLINKKVKTKANYTYAIISVALVLFLLGFFGALLIHGSQLIRYFKENVAIMIEISPTADQKRIVQLKETLKNRTFVKNNSIEYTNKEEAAELLREDFGEDFMKFGFNNPFYDVISFNVNADYMQKDSLDAIVSLLKAEPIIVDVVYRENLVNDIGSSIGKLGWVGLLLSLSFIFIAFLLIHNTIKLALYSNRFIIKNMQLVGASWDFISRPYIRKGIRNGLISAMIAITALVFLMFIILNDIPELKAIRNPLALGILFLLLIFLGVTISGFSSYYTVKKYLRTKIDDLY